MITDTELIFSLNGRWNGDEMRSSYRCEGCFRFSRKCAVCSYRIIFLEKLRLKIAGVTVLHGAFVDYDPDLAGTAPHGHLCQKQDMVAELEVQMRGSFAKRTNRMTTRGGTMSKENELVGPDTPGKV